MSRPHRRPLVYGFAIILAIVLVAVGLLGCTDDELSRDDLTLGSGATATLGQLWEIAAEQADTSDTDATLVQLEMTLSPAMGMSVSPGLTARIEELYFVAWAHGPTIRVTGTWPASGPGKLLMETDEEGNDSMPVPVPVGYPLAMLFAQFDRVGLSEVLNGLLPYTDTQSARLLLVYPPPSFLYSQQWDVPLLVLRDDSLELVPFGESAAWRTDPRKWLGLPGVFQVLSPSSEKLFAILAVEESETAATLPSR